MMQKTYARTVGKRIGVKKKKLITDLLPKLELDQNNLPNHDDIVFEIGFGTGVFTAHYAINNPNEQIIACEPFINGVASLLEQISENNISNIKIYSNDARVLLEKIPVNYISKVFIFFPDPWPKKKHQKRRLLQADFLEFILPKLKIFGQVYFATDDEDYANSALTCFTQNSRLEWVNKSNFLEPFEFFIKTRYYEKAIKQKKEPFFFQFKKIS
jgi:tRNA (guanine-N7-)-methyltransferase